MAAYKINPSILDGREPTRQDVLRQLGSIAMILAAKRVILSFPDGTKFNASTERQKKEWGSMLTSYAKHHGITVEDLEEFISNPSLWKQV